MNHKDQKPCLPTNHITRATGVMKALSLATVLSLAIPDISGHEAFTVNDGWRFKFDTDTASAAVHIPHCWNEDAYHTRNYRRGTGTYEKQIHIPERFDGSRIYLRVDGAASKSEVAIDGKPVGKHTGAYSAHTVDITPFVRPGSSHRLTITVDNADRSIAPYSADFTFMGGLYRDVWLIGASPIHLDITEGPAEGVKINPSLLADGSGRLDVNGTIVNSTQNKAGVTVTARLLSPSGSSVVEKTSRLNLTPESSRDFKIDFGRLADVQPWSPESPTLYRLVTEISEDGKVVDSTQTYVGFRSFGFDSEGRFLLNGQPYKLRGMCRHQDQRPIGIALTDEQHRRDMELIKDMGANFIRISHYPQDDAILEMCDRLGLIAWEEVPVIDYVPEGDDFAANSETMLREMIRRHYNHPSVAMWGYMNEILLRTPREGREETHRRTLSLAKRLEDVLAEEDSTRLSTMAFHGSDVYHEAGLADITDVKGWNLYQGWYGGELKGFEDFLSRQHRQHPDHRLIVSEYGAGSDLRLHSLAPEPFDFSMEYQQDYLEHYLPVIEDSAFVAGASHWNFIDFSSANRAESMPHINNKGLVTNDRRKKDVYHYYQAAWTDPAKATVAHIATRDWPVRTEICEDNNCVVRPLKVYTNLPEIGMTVNGHNLPAKKVENHTALFDAPLTDGINVIRIFSPDSSSDILDAATVDVRLIKVTDGRLDLGHDELAVNVGSNCYFRSDDSGLTWLPDREYVPGSLYGHKGGRRNVSQDEIALTSDTPLLQHNLTDLEEYRLELLPGRYEVELGFADLASPSALSAYMLGHNAGTGSNPTDMAVSINGRTVEESFAPAKESGVKTMVKRRYLAETDADGNLTVSFTPLKGATSLSTLKVRKL